MACARLVYSFCPMVPVVMDSLGLVALVYEPRSMVVVSGSPLFSCSIALAISSRNCGVVMTMLFTVMVVGSAWLVSMLFL